MTSSVEFPPSHGATDVPAPARTLRRGVSLHVLQAAFPVLGILPLLGFAIVLVYLQWDGRRQETRRELQQVTSTLAVAVERELATSIRQLERVAEMPTLNPGTLDEFHRYARGLLKVRGEWDDIWLVAPDGTRVVDATVPFGDPLPRVERPHERRVFETGEPALSDVYSSAGDGELALAVSVPVIRDARVAWVLTARLDPLELALLLQQQLLRPEVVASVVDRQWRVVARSRDPQGTFGQFAAADYIERARGSVRGVAEVVTIEGSPVLSAWERLPFGWTVGVGVPPAVYQDPLLRHVGMLAAVGLGLFSAGLIASLWLARRIAAAVETAARDAGNLAAEQALPRRDSRIQQIGALLDSLHRASGRLAEAAAGRNRALADLREGVRRRDEFLAMLAHELRNPLAPITNATRVLMRERQLGEAGQQALRMIDRQTRQLTRLVDDLLDASRLSTGKIALRLAPMALGAAVRESVEAIRPMALARGQTVVAELPAEDVVVLADAPRIAQVLHNLLSNACKFGRDGGRIGVALGATPHEAVVRVTDDGIGIDPERLVELFEPFRQLDPGLDRAAGGLGLGLALVRQLVEMHGGSASVASAGKGRGAIFTVRLPRDGRRPAPAA